MLEQFQLEEIRRTKHHIFYTTTNEDYEGVLKLEKYKKERFEEDLKDGITPYQWELLIEESENKDGRCF